MDIKMVIFEAIKKILDLREEDCSTSLSPFGLVVKIKREYGNRNLKMIIIDDGHKEVCILYEDTASPYDIGDLTRLGQYQVCPIKHIQEDNNPDRFYMDPNIDGICLKMSYK